MSKIKGICLFFSNSHTTLNKFHLVYQRKVFSSLFIINGYLCAQADKISGWLKNLLITSHSGDNFIKTHNYIYWIARGKSISYIYPTTTQQQQMNRTDSNHSFWISSAGCFETKMFYIYLWMMNFVGKWNMEGHSHLLSILINESFSEIYFHSKYSFNNTFHWVYCRVIKRVLRLAKCLLASSLASKT